MIKEHCQGTCLESAILRDELRKTQDDLGRLQQTIVPDGDSAPGRAALTALELAQRDGHVLFTDDERTKMRQAVILVDAWLGGARDERDLDRVLEAFNVLKYYVNERLTPLVKHEKE